MSLFDWLRRFRRSRLTALESRMVEAVSGALPPEARSLFNAQLALVNKVQRLSAKEVNLYASPSGRALKDELRFPLRSVALLATVCFSSGRGDSSLRGEVWLVDGRVFSLIFNKPPERRWNSVSRELKSIVIP